MELKQQFEAICNKYIETFCKKQEFDIRDVEVLDVGYNYNIADFYFSFNNIMYDVDNKVKKDMIIKYYDYSLEQYGKNEKCANYKIFVEYYQGFGKVI